MMPAAVKIVYLQLALIHIVVGRPMDFYGKQQALCDVV